MEKIKVKNIKKEYKNRIQNKYGDRETFTADEIINISLELFDEVKIKEIKYNKDFDYLDDFLSFQSYFNDEQKVFYDDTAI